MYYKESKKRRSFKWVYLIVLVGFVIWVMSDELGEQKQVETQIEVTLPK